MDTTTSRCRRTSKSSSSTARSTPSASTALRSPQVRPHYSSIRRPAPCLENWYSSAILPVISYVLNVKYHRDVVFMLTPRQTDYPDTLAGNIALIPRGVCAFGLKSAWAGSKGAIGAVMYGGDDENARCPTRPSLGNFVRPEGKLIPSVCINRAFGEQFVSAVASGASLSAVVDVTTDIRNISTTNVLATTVGGDQNNKLALGAHSDSTNGGPGINDNGSGVVAVLEIAKALTKYKVKNAVMLGFWTANMLGLLGSTHYVNNLSADEAAKIRAYLDVDVVRRVPARAHSRD